MRSTRFQRAAVALSFSLVGGAAAAQTATPVTDFKAGPGNGLYSYPSTTPPTVMELIQPNRPRPAATAQAQLVLPDGGGDARLPAVVLVHGSGGIYPEQVTFWAKRFNEHGIAAMVIDVFGPRGVKSTGEDQSQVPFAADTADAYAALSILATHPRIDPKRIAVMGFSRGGITALRSGAVRIADGLLPGGPRFAAHIGLYAGGCTGTTSLTVKPGVFTGAPVLLVHGSDDDYTFASDCRAYADKLAANGVPAEFVLLPGARHKFDVDDPKRLNLRNNVKTKEGCPVEFDVVDLTFRDRRSGESMNTEKMQALAKELCADKGATMEGSRSARDAAAKAVDGFLAKVFKL